MAADQGTECFWKQGNDDEIIKREKIDYVNKLTNNMKADGNIFDKCINNDMITESWTGYEWDINYKEEAGMLSSDQSIC